MDSGLVILLLNGVQSRAVPWALCYFALAMEPLAAAIRQDTSIRGISLNNHKHKISLYADDVLIFLAPLHILSLD